MIENSRAPSLRRRLLLRSVPFCLIALACAACGDLLDVESNPETIDAGRLTGPGSFAARYFGAQGDFITAFDEAALLGGLFTDELVWGGSFLARDEIDRRVVRPSNDVVSGLYTQLQVAAYSSKSLQRDMLADAFPEQVPDPPNHAALARISLYAGYSRLLLADLFCTLAFDGQGPELTSQDVYARAIEEFDRTLAASDVEADVRNAALVGRARARLARGDGDGALADALLVPEDFVFVQEYSTNTGREQNDLFGFLWGNRRLTVAEAFRGLTIDGGEMADPRVDVRTTGQQTFNGNFPLWAPQKYATASASIRLASWEEARLIIAEVRGGAEARAIINELRDRWGIPPFDPSDTASEDEIMSKLFEERARLFFLEGQRMADARRYIAHYGLDVFPTGPTHGDQTCMPLPDVERDNNPGLRDS